MNTKPQTWEFTNRNGDFVFPNADKNTRLYFPLANEAELMSSITPGLKGDIKTDQNHFLLQPVSSEDLYNIQTSRNFWLYFNASQTAWSVAGSQAHPEDRVTVQAGILWHTVCRINTALGIRAEVTNFVPANSDHVEIMIVKLTNISGQVISFIPTSAVPIFGRSADNLRDHRHVTSLLNRVKMLYNGVVNTPTMSFDERGHKINYVSYFVLGVEEDGTLPEGCFPTIESFLGEESGLDTPRAVLKNMSPVKKIAAAHQGKEAIGALRFAAKTLMSDESVSYILLLGIGEKPRAIEDIFHRYNHKDKVITALSENKDHWRKKIDAISFRSGDHGFDNWLRWVTLQPILRKIFGCSYLPDFDYGRGGKGWRDLWQDCLSLIFIHPRQMRPILSANFSGIRIDGTNATIITKRPGYFIADRNKISRVWMDHGVWPFFTIQLYMHQTGDLNILFESHTYFYDQLLSRATEIDHTWDPRRKHCKHLHTMDGKLYKGTILEHILVQHLTAFFNVGKHNTIRLEDADWNDGLDMAHQKGESVAFTCFFASNLYDLTMMLKELKQRNRTQLFVLKELRLLLDTLAPCPVDYASPDQKQRRLQKYLAAVRCRVSGDKVALDVDALINDLTAKWQWLFSHVRRQEWMPLTHDTGIFNGYYDNKGKRVEGAQNGDVRMTLTGQVFPILSGIATTGQVAKMFQAACSYLRDRTTGGFRLNTNFKSLQFDLGRAFAFSYGSKENGAVFSHMCVMFANALYRRGFIKEGFSVLRELFELAANMPRSKIYPCLPEYFDIEGRGMYSYLTGSASWMVMTMLTEVFGIRGLWGDLVIAPQFTAEQFATTDTLAVSCYFAEHRISFEFRNPRRREAGAYRISRVVMSPHTIPYSVVHDHSIMIKRKHLLALDPAGHLTIDITLD